MASASASSSSSSGAKPRPPRTGNVSQDDIRVAGARPRPTTPSKGKSGRSAASRAPSSASTSSGAAASTNMVEEAMKRRLYIEHHGDEAKILKLMKMVACLGADRFGAAPPEKVDSLYWNMNVLVHQLGFNARRDSHVIKNLESSSGIYELLSEGIGVEIEKTQELISSLRNKATQIDQDQRVNVALSAAKSLVQKLPSTEAGESIIAEHQAKVESSLKKKRAIVENIKQKVHQANKVREELCTLAQIHEKSKDLIKK